MERGQLACPACGGVLRGRFGPHVGPRSPSAIAAVGLLLLAAVAGGAYIVLAPAPKPQSGAAAGTPHAAADPASAAPSGTTGANTVTTPSPPGIGTPTPTPTVKATRGAATSSVPTKSRTSTGNNATTSTGATATPATGATPPAAASTPTSPSTPATLTLGAAAATTYNPYGAPASSFSPAAKALAGNPMTVWTYKLDPAADGATNVGVGLDLGSPRSVTAIRLATESPGMSVEFYGATGAPPATITASGWVHLASRASLAPQARVALDARGQRFDYLLIWITHAPPGVNAGALSISGLSVTD